ncbi:hypothetical protein L596_016511 [Steinernema carpocapsae]|uniref:Major facilitator superfamily (MFS) profile domain-containing protein n=1 Tax=Steinernema carpocapsae TaxID=34508 RepID=A0A4U5NIZ2_STECR|nr:hypothetical protein L596_016511 [Steinernema carpocapsae]
MLRYVILALAVVCCSFILGNTLLFHFTVICSDPGRNNETLSHDGRIFTTVQENWIFSALSFGRLIAVVPIMKIIDMVGLRLTFTILGLTSGIATFVAPFGSDLLYFRMLTRFLQGIAVPSVFAALGTIPNTWADDKEKARFISVITCCYQGTLH